MSSEEESSKEEGSIISDVSRRDFLKYTSVGSIAAALGLSSLDKDAFATEPGKYKAAYAALGSEVYWVKLGIETFKDRGRLLGFDFDIFDARLSVSRQRSQLETIASQANKYDAVFVHPGAVGAFRAPIKSLINSGTPVFDIDTKLVEDMSTLDVVTFTEPDNVWMGEQVTEALCKAIDYEGGIVQTQGPLTHTGAQGRAKGFRNVVEKYPDVEVLDESVGAWSRTKTRQIWNDLLTKYGNKIKAGFFHNDDMALAGQQACVSNGYKAGSEGILIGGVDAMAPALREMKKGRMYATVQNPTSRDHGYALWAAWYMLEKGESADSIPDHLICDSYPITADMPLDEFIWENSHHLY